MARTFGFDGDVEAEAVCENAWTDTTSRTAAASFFTEVSLGWHLSIKHSYFEIFRCQTTEYFVGVWMEVPVVGFGHRGDVDDVVVDVGDGVVVVGDVAWGILS